MPEEKEQEIVQALDKIERYYRSQKMAEEIGFGDKPALLIVDFQQGITDPQQPAGVDLSWEIENTVQLLENFRRIQQPIFFFIIAYHDPLVDGKLITRKVPVLANFTMDSDAIKIDPRIAPQPGEPVLVKKYFSCFHGTPLASILHGLEVDTVIITGCITSSCIRATAVDALQYGFRPIIPRECVGDRSSIPHLVNLLDIQARCGDVVALKTVLHYLNAL